MGRSRHKRALIFYLAAVFLFFALSFGSGITRVYGFTLFPDEFGYWSPAAAAVGYDWSGVTAHGSYYSFGYSLLLAPILFCCKHALWAYRIALFINALLLGAAFVLLPAVIRRLIPDSAPPQRVLGAGIALCYPPYLLYRNMTMTETLLVFCFVLLCRLLLWYLERPAFGRFAAAGLCAVYMYTVHMRSLPILCACVGCMVPAWFRNAGRRPREDVRGEEQASRKSRMRESGWRQWGMLFAASAVVVAAVFFSACIKERIQAQVYGEADRALLSVNDYGGQFAGMKKIFTLNGFSELIVSLIGKVYYLSLASFGLFFAGIWFFCQKIKEHKAAAGERIFSLFMLLSCAGEILVCAVFTRGYGRIDNLCYGRYDELILAVLMAFGFFEVLHMKYPLRYAAAVIFGGLPVTAMLEMIISGRRLTDINGGYFIPGLSYLLHDGTFEPEYYFWKAYALAVILIALMLTVLLVVRRQKGLMWLLLIWIGVETLLGMRLNEDMVYRQSRVRYRDMRMVTVLRELGSESPGRRIVCYGGQDAGSYAAVVQFELRDETISFFSPQETDRLRERDLVMACEGEDREALTERYTKHEVYGIFHLYYNGPGA